MQTQTYALPKLAKPILRAILSYNAEHAAANRWHLAASLHARCVALGLIGAEPGKFGFTYPVLTSEGEAFAAQAKEYIQRLLDGIPFAEYVPGRVNIGVCERAYRDRMKYSAFWTQPHEGQVWFTNAHFGIKGKPCKGIDVQDAPGCSAKNGRPNIGRCIPSEERGSTFIPILPEYFAGKDSVYLAQVLESDRYIVMTGGLVVNAAYFDAVNACHPGVKWFGQAVFETGEVDKMRPMIARKRGRTVALVMPIQPDTWRGNRKR